MAEQVKKKKESITVPVGGSLRDEFKQMCKSCDISVNAAIKFLMGRKVREYKQTGEFKLDS